MRSNFFKYSLKSSALGYAISFLLLIALICSGVLFISSVNKRLEVNYIVQNHMLLNNYLSLKIGAQSKIGSKTLIHNSGDTSQIVIKEWGAFKVIVVKTFHNYKYIEKTAIIGNAVELEKPALYLPGQRNILNLCGDTRIEGTVYVAERGVKRGHISGKPYIGEKLIYGKKKISDRSLPELKASVFDDKLQGYLDKSVRIELPKSDSSFSFTREISMVNSSGPITIQNTIKGNCVIHSFDSIFVASTAILENVILIAPVIYFEKGFIGSAQIHAKERVTCEENVFLKYPSTINLIEENGNGEKEHGVFLNPNSKLIGGVVLSSKKPNFRNPIQLVIDKAIIGGLIYNQGETELRGEIIGSIYTNSFKLKTGGGQYNNYLLNAKISSKLLPENFISPIWLKSDNIKQSKIISCF